MQIAAAERVLMNRQFDKKLGWLLVLAGLAGARTSIASAAAQTTLYVTPTGGTETCTQSAPCSIEGAQAQVRTLTGTQNGDIVVQFAGGLYRRTTPIAFGPLDSGGNGHQVIYEAAPGTQVTVSGAIQLTGWTQVSRSATPNLWSAHVPSGYQSQDLYVNGVRADLTRGPRIPASGYSLSLTDLTLSNSQYAAWGNQSQIQVFFDGWDQRTGSCPLTTITAAGSSSILTGAQPCWANALDPMSIRGTVSSLQFPYTGWEGLSKDYAPAGIWIVNAKELLGTPGQFYLDPSTQSMYYTPRTGENMTTADVEMPVANQLVTMAGTPGSILETDATSATTTFSGAWSLTSSNEYGDFGDTMASTSTAGDSAGFTFTGAGIDVLSELNSDQGIIAVYLDGNPVADEQIDTSTTGVRLAQQVVYTKSGLPPGTHSVKLVNTDGKVMRVDAFAVVPSAITPVRNVTISGITFEYSTFADPTTPLGFPDNQNATTFTLPPINQGLTRVTHAPGAINIQRSNNVSFVNNKVLHVGTTGIDLALGTQNSTLSGNLIADAAICGINLGDYDDFWIADPLRMTSGNVVQNNVISAVGARYADTAGIAAGFMRNTTVTHNEIAYSPYLGVSYGWGYEWTFSGSGSPTRHGTNYTRGNTISYNYIHDTNTVITDGAEIYLETNEGTATAQTSITHNYLNAPASALSAGAFYFDGGAANIHVSDNVADQFSNDDLNLDVNSYANDSFTSNYATFLSNPVKNGIVYASNSLVTNGNWPVAARTITADAGVQSTFASLAPPAAVIGGDQEYTGLRTPVSISYNGSGWGHLRNLRDGPLGADISYTSAKADSVTFSFTGTGLTVFCQDASDRGVMSVTLDGQAYPNANAYSALPIPRARLFEVHNLNYGTHTLVLTNTDGKKDTIDGYLLDGYVNDNSPDLLYTGSWTHSPSRSYANDNQKDVHYTSTNGNSVSLTFYGTGIAVITEMCREEGLMSIAIDGVQEGNYNGYTSGARLSAQVLYSTTQLPLGLHTITLTKVSGTYMLLDSLAVYGAVPGPDMTCDVNDHCTTLGNIVN
jgi:hypothetical protein